MNLQRLSIFGTDNIGVYIYTNNKYTVVPRGLDSETKENIVQILGTELIEAEISRSFLLGIFISGNDNGILLPKSTIDDEFRFLKENLRDCRVEVLNSKVTALGNTILTNNKAALIYPEFNDIEEKIIKETLGVEEIRRGKIAQMITVGSVGVVTNKGGLVHVDTSEKELKELEKLFGVKIDIGTVNFGSVFIRSGLVANDKGTLVGASTTGPEILRIQKALGE
ncbi:translation initiation factor IF-6 [Saccharolobus islandicus]|uniref:Translation initiation factor 6 n=3 Tax=Saccharolobus islandicus TaxID=43080 RepID=IF6_SACI3|nr:translation initiation factor IF-6 [Sulfolobus islandicus]C3MXG7.1 RecName: Full=Translation initiation factor 6; Short=aIF-6 [Sulfolobus islandicus M.14.25]C3MZB3.1 RecName: Full=Translation initiation factor 6; Short=aIF-6 [Sulfolobus islandicus M.16.27]C4KIJ1.1 RecName: Full=Translation initiation factor 6; Short=aIF-6 [Sulfolobus islandicus M.16.4]ACP38501.1 translation initiation factor eIF-6 [Sulfolobus islandicus M.14.25]ACP55745.1 translation initiation factor eIF-6 [Sulfolobus isla